MKHTDVLSVYGTRSQKQTQVVINPNDGYDLGFMTATQPLTIFAGCSLPEFTADGMHGIAGQIVLQNSCKPGTVHLSLATTARLGNPRNVTIYVENDRLLILKS